MNTFNILLFLFLTIMFTSTLGQFAGMDYQMRRNGNCVSYDQLVQDLRNIKAYANSVRLYTLIDCNQGSLVLQATRDLEMTVFFGLIPLPDNIYGMEKEQLININQSLGLDGVIAITVGSGGLSRGDYTADEITQDIYDLKGLVHVSLWAPDIPVTTVDDYSLIQEPIITASDILVFSSFPYWEGVSSKRGPSKLFTHVADVKTRAQGKPVWVGETGWPTDGSDVGSAHPSMEDLTTYLSVACEAQAQNVPIFWFEAFDDLDKPAGVEQHWGLYDSTGNKKLGFQLNCTLPTTTTTDSISSTSGDISTTTTSDGTSVSYTFYLIFSLLFFLGYF